VDEARLLRKAFRAGTHENFALHRKANLNVPLPFQVQDANLRWGDGTWANLDIPDQLKAATPSAAELSTFVKENEQLRIECEILLHFLTLADLEKEKKAAFLAALKQRIATLLERVSQMFQEGNFSRKI
jgi:hypothetical protein